MLHTKLHGIKLNMSFFLPGLRQEETISFDFVLCAYEVPALGDRHGSCFLRVSSRVEH